MSANLNYVIRLDAETQGLRQANQEWRNFIGSIKAGIGIDIGGRLVSGIQELQNTLKSAAMAGVDFRSKIEDLAVSYRTLLGSSELANMRIAELAQFAAKTPFELPGIGKANKILETLTKGALSTMEGMELVGDAAAVADVPIEELAMNIGRVYDALQSGRPVGEAMRHLQALGLISGETRNKIEALQAAGEKGPAVWNVAKEALSRYAGEMDNRSRTFTGRMSTLRDAWNAAMGEMMAGATGAATGGAKDLADALAKPETVQALREMGANIARVTKSLAELAVWAAKNVGILKEVADAVVKIGVAWATYKVGMIVTGAARTLPMMLAGAMGTRGNAQLAAHGAGAMAGGAGAAGAMAAATKWVTVGDSKLIAAANAAKAQAAEMAAKSTAAAARAAAFTTAAQTAQVGHLAQAANAARLRAEAGLAARSAADAAKRAELAAWDASESYKAVQVKGSGVVVGGRPSRFGGMAGAAGVTAVQAYASMDDQKHSLGQMALNVGTSAGTGAMMGAGPGAAIGAGIAIAGEVFNYLGATKAENIQMEKLAAMIAKVNAGYSEQITKLQSLDQKQQLIETLDKEIAQAKEKASDPTATILEIQTMDILISRLEQLKKKTEDVSDAELKRLEVAAAEKRAKEEAELNTKVNRKALDKMNVEIAQDKSAFQEEFQGAERPRQIEMAGKYIADLRKEQEANNPEKFLGGDQEEFKEKASRYKQLYAEITSWEQRLTNMKKAENREETQRTIQARKATLNDLRPKSYNELLSGGSADQRVGLLSNNARQAIEGGAAARGKGPMDAQTLEKIRAGIDKLVELNKQQEDTSGMWSD